MKIFVAAIFGLFFMPLTVFASESKPVGVGIDFGLPFDLAVNGKGNHQRANFNLGIEGRHWLSDQMNYGVRFAFDTEKQSGSVRQVSLSPGFAHHWMPLENWRPFLRFDLPIILKGAANSKGSSSQKDMGISGGAGFVWKLGDALGIENMEFRYDFDIFYVFGLGDAVSVIGLDLFRAGLDYRF